MTTRGSGKTLLTGKTVASVRTAVTFLARLSGWSGETLRSDGALLYAEATRERLGEWVQRSFLREEYLPQILAVRVIQR